MLSDLAASGLAIAWVGPGWVFIINAATFLAPALTLLLLRVDELYDVPRAPRAKGQLREGLAYVRSRSDLLVIIVVISVVSMLTLNFQVTMAAMVRSAFDLESDAYGTVSSVFAVGSLGGALWAARRKAPRVRTLVVGSFLLGVFSLLMAAMPTYPLFAMSTVPVGLCVLTVLTSANQTVQLSTAPAVRGRVMSIYMLFFLGTTPIGSPVIGWVSDQWGPRAAIAVGGVAAVVVSVLAGLWAVFHGCHHTRHPGLDQTVGTGPCPSMMGTGLKRDIGGCAARPLARLLQRQHFGMGLARPPVPAFAHHLAIPHDDAAHTRIGRGGVDALPGQVDGPLHGPAIVFGVHVSVSS